MNSVTLRNANLVGLQLPPPLQAMAVSPVRGARHSSRALAVQPKPFLKWVGGKGRLLRTLLPMLPPGAERMRHVEPFLGGGAMFFARAPARALLSDVNSDLVQTYCAVRDDVQAVSDHLGHLAADYCEEHYYQVRARFNARERGTSTERAALFIYLNKTCFNGLYRVNKRGFFNSPMGRYARPAIADVAALQTASIALAHAELRCAPFEALLSEVRVDDFVYLDPPYEPVSRTANFTAYASECFTQADQARLREVYGELDRRGAKLMLSSSDVPFVEHLYRGYRVDRVRVLRAVNCNPAKRGPVSELVIRNY